MTKILFVSAMLVSTKLMAQEEQKPSITWSGFVEAYYQYDFNKPSDNNRPPFVYSHNRHNEFNINLGFLKGSYNAEKVRANLALAAGTYMNANYAAEPGVLKNIYEANAGLKLGKKNNLWLDAGIFTSHIGFEGAISKDCWNLTRSILADNSPYYEAGAKLTYTTNNGKLLFSALALNGWQRIKRIDGNSLMSWGSMVQYKPSGNVLFNYSTFIGTDKPDSARLNRIFHNLYGVFDFEKKVKLIVGFDIGTEEKTTTGGGRNTWYAPVAIIKYSFNNTWAVAGRIEHYHDRYEVIIATGTTNGFQTTGYSINFDYAPANNILVRLEGRNFCSKDKIFVKQNNFTNKNIFITSSIAVTF